MSEDDEADPEEEAAQYERNRYDPDWPERANPLKKGVSAKKKKTIKPKVQRAPPFNPNYTQKKEPARDAKPGTSFCSEVWK